MASPRISVVTIVKDDARGLERTACSVAEQTLALEYIVVDGGSKEETLDVMRRYAAHIHSSVSEPDRGIAHALNKGAALATGDLLLFLNAGDAFCARDSLALAVAALPAGSDVRNEIYYADALYIHAGGSEVLETDHRKLGETNSICHPSVLIGANVQRDLPYDERLAIYMDYDVWLRARGRYAFVRLPMTLSTFSAGGISGAAGSGDARLPIELAVVQLLNGLLPPDSATVARLLGAATWFDTKRRVRRVIGPRAFHALRRLIGRRTPAAWASPADDA